jgi:hypothetical protein
MKVKVLLVMFLACFIAAIAFKIAQASPGIPIEHKPEVILNPQGPTAPFEMFQGQDVELQAPSNIRYQW